MSMSPQQIEWLRALRQEYGPHPFAPKKKVERKPRPNPVTKPPVPDIPPMPGETPIAVSPTPVANPYAALQAQLTTLFPNGVPPGLARAVAKGSATGAFRAPGLERKAAYMQGGNRKGGKVPMKRGGFPNMQAMGYGQ